MDAIEVNNLTLSVEKDEIETTLVNDISFKLRKGETLGIVGESGSGKSLTSLSLIGLLPRAIKVKNGEIKINGEDILKLNKRNLRAKRGNEISIIFQEPMTSLNPVFTIGSQIVEMIRNHNKISKQKAHDLAVSLIKQVGIPRPEEVVNEFPHQLSGGMRQRVMIALAIANNPSVLLADEPTTALDVTIQAQIMELLKKVQKDFDMSILLVTHDLGVIADMCDYVLVMYGGEIVEKATVNELFTSPKHPYTKGLLKALPRMEESREYLDTIKGNVPLPNEFPTGCRFADRCPNAMDICFSNAPRESKFSETNTARCWLYEKNTDEITLTREEVHYD